MTTILAISGSLRAHSTNTTLLVAAARLAPPGVQIDLYKAFGDLPLFNPDLNGKEPEAVRKFQAALAAADGILICSPEYAHGVSGAMKNGLDWLVSDVNLVGKSVALINASERARRSPMMAARRFIYRSEAPVRIELTNSRFAVCRLTTWPRRRKTKLSGREAPEQSRRPDAERQSRTHD